MNIERQRQFYESRASVKDEDEPAANWFTNRWTTLRRKLQRVDSEIGLRNTLNDLHKEWLGDLSGKNVLDLGCFTGNDLTFYLAHNADNYVGIDLSHTAIDQLQEHIGHLLNVRLLASDVMEAGFSRNEFDVIYAHSVIHHFKDLDELGQELGRILKPGGMIISVDPLKVDPINRLARMAYRPFQSDRDWEWPLSRRSLNTIRRYYELDRIQGFRGLSKLGYISTTLGKWGLDWDKKHATNLGVPLYLCWLITLRWRPH